MRAPKVCTTPGCPAVADPGTSHCPQHARPPWHGKGGRHGGSDWTYRTITRPAVLARDRYTCTDCGATGVTLEVDHLDRLADGAPLQAPLHRLETVCVPCHRRREQARNTEARKGTTQPTVTSPTPAHRNPNTPTHVQPGEDSPPRGGAPHPPGKSSRRAYRQGSGA